MDGLRGVVPDDGSTPFARLADSAALDLFDLRGSLDKRLGTLSGGTSQKINAALAFRYGADLLILDEPTAGLDPLSRSRLKDLIRREHARGATVLVTSHVLSELRDLAEHIVYLVDGRKRYEGAIDGLLRTTGTNDLERAVARLMEADALDPCPRQPAMEAS